MERYYFALVKNGYYRIQHFETDSAAEEECVIMNRLTDGGWTVKKILCG